MDRKEREKSSKLTIWLESHFISKTAVGDEGEVGLSTDFVTDVSPFTSIAVVN